MNGGEANAAPDWAKLRHDYENGTRPVAEIAGEAGLTGQKLAIIARREGWALRGPSKPRSEATRATLKRLKTLLQQRIADLEGQIASLGAEADAAASERDIRAVNTLVRTLEKVLELERKDRTARSKRRRQHREFGDAERDALAQRLEALHRQWLDEAAERQPAADIGS